MVEKIQEVFTRNAGQWRIWEENKSEVVYLAVAVLGDTKSGRFAEVTSLGRRVSTLDFPIGS